MNTWATQRIQDNHIFHFYKSVHLLGGGAGVQVRKSEGQLVGVGFALPPCVPWGLDSAVRLE